MTLTPSARGRSSEFRNDHDLYVSSALSSPCADVNLLDVGHPMFNSEASLKHLVRHQRIRTSGNLSKRPAGTREQRWCVLPMWMTWWTFWMVLVCITAILAVSLVNILSTKNLLDLEHKESVLGLAQALEATKQLQPPPAPLGGFIGRDPVARRPSGGRWSKGSQEVREAGWTNQRGGTSSFV
ncbi:unnamed protein product [Durusdinium trenchii]|uniref:Uncharacterized protein n=1 Tax=Durusdinium trenchii TaxID=1381693 RepID=A0ABP0PEN0_9DINO